MAPISLPTTTNPRRLPRIKTTRRAVRRGREPGLSIIQAREPRASHRMVRLTKRSDAATRQEVEPQTAASCRGKLASWMSFLRTMLKSRCVPIKSNHFTFETTDSIFALGDFCVLRGQLRGQGAIFFSFIVTIILPSSYWICGNRSRRCLAAHRCHREQSLSYLWDPR